MRRPALFALVLLALPAFAEPPAQAYLRAAAKLYQALEYEKAIEQLQRAKKVAGGLDDDVKISLWEGILYSELGRTDDARAAFNTALALHADADLPVKVSPKVSAAFEKLRVEAQKDLAKNPPPVAVAPTPAPVPAPAVVEAPPPVPPPAVAAPEPAPKPGSARRFALIPFYVGGAGAVAAIVGVLGASDAAGKLRSQRFATAGEAMGVRDAGAAFQIAGFVGLGVGVVGILTGTLMLLLGGPADPAPIVFAVHPGGAAASFQWELP